MILPLARRTIPNQLVFREHNLDLRKKTWPSPW